MAAPLLSPPNPVCFRSASLCLTGALVPSRSSPFAAIVVVVASQLRRGVAARSQLRRVSQLRAAGVLPGRGVARAPLLSSAAPAKTTALDASRSCAERTYCTSVELAFVSGVSARPRCDAAPATPALWRLCAPRLCTPRLCAPRLCACACPRRDAELAHHASPFLHLDRCTCTD